jgi:hypothetical protein
MVTPRSNLRWVVLIRSRSTASLALVALFLLSAALCLNPVPGHAGIVLLNFEELRTVDADPIHIVGQVYIHDGVRLTAVLGPGTVDPNNTRLEYAGTLATGFAGSTMLRQGFDGSGIVLDLVNGGTFSLLFLQLAEWPELDSTTGKPIGSGTFPVTFTGVRANGTMITETVNVDRFPTVDSFIFPGFVGLTSVQWFQGGGFTPGFGANQFDNILVFVPEPGTFWLLGLGSLLLSLLGSSRWRSGTAERAWKKIRKDHAIIGLTLLVVATIAVTFTASTGHGATDRACLDKCLGDGYRFGYCQKQCAIQESPAPIPSPPSQTPRPPQPSMPNLSPIQKLDAQCMSDCTRQGSSPNFCRQRCTY